jgi:hypothetical protein
MVLFLTILGSTRGLRAVMMPIKDDSHLLGSTEEGVMVIFKIGSHFMLGLAWTMIL